MAVSYLSDLEQLSALAHYAGIDAFPGLPDLPRLSLARGGEVIQRLTDLGMLRRQGAAVSVDFGLAFVLSVMAEPGLLLRTAGGALCYCADRLGVTVVSDAHRERVYRITPLPDAPELVEHVWESADTVDGSLEISIWSHDGGWGLPALMNRTEAERLVAQVYIKEPYIYE